VAAQVLVRLGADLNRVRQQVIQLLNVHPPEKPGPGAWVRLEMVEQRLTAIEQRVGIGPDTSDLDEQIEAVRTEKEAAVDAQDFDRAASLRDREKQLLAAKAARQEQWAAGHPAKPDLAERWQQLADEVERLRALLRQHGIDPQDKPA
jgi:predicted nuclease with TOPRIM domain